MITGELVGVVLVFVGVFIVFYKSQKKKIGKLEEEHVELLNKNEKEIEELSKNNNELSEMLPPLEKKAAKFDEITNSDELIEEKKGEIEKLNTSLEEIKKMIEPHQQHIDLMESGFFRYKFNFEDVDKYSEALMILKEAQKVLIKEYKALKISIKELEGTDIYKSLTKLALIAFNGEVEAVMKKVNYSNYDSCSEKIVKSFDTITL